MVAKTTTTFERGLRIYTQQIKNLDHPDDVMTESLLVLSTRESFVEDYPLSQEQQRRLDRLDDELVKRWEVLAEALPNPNFADNRRRWWWFLHEGPQVREQARALAAD